MTAQEDVVKDLGPALRAARIDRGLTLRRVASLVGVSASLVSQVETGKTRPSLTTLSAMCELLGLSFATLLHGGIRPDGSGVDLLGRALSAHPVDQLNVQSAEDNPAIEIEGDIRWERLSTLATGPGLPVIVTYRPGASDAIEGRAVRHRGWQYAYLLSGELCITIEGRSTTVLPGDSLHFDSTRPHSCRNQGREPAVGLWLFVSAPTPA